jgi:hypothetical protein
MLRSAFERFLNRMVGQNRMEGATEELPLPSSAHFLFAGLVGALNPKAIGKRTE